MTRKTFDIFDQVDELLVEEYNQKRQCPFCGRPLAEADWLLPRPERASKEPPLPENTLRPGQSKPKRARTAMDRKSP